MRVLPTILATQNSRAFRAPRAGTVVRIDGIADEGEPRDVNLDEAIAMGYSASELRMTGGMSDEELAGILGLAMDRRAMKLLFAVAEASTTNEGTRRDRRRIKWKLAPMEVANYKTRHRKTFSKAGDKPVEANSAPEWAPVEREKETRLPRLADTVRLTAMMANVTQQEAFGEKHPDIHENALCLEWLKTGGSASIPKEDYHRVRKRAARHRWDELTGELYMITINGKELRRHNWVGLKQDVKAVVTQGETCQRVKTHYAREEAMLTPLEIKSFMYRWSLDLAWPTKCVAKAGNQRILIMTEHYTRFIVCVPIPNKEASAIARAFRNHGLSCLIDRRVTSPDSPEGNGLTERVVRTIKFCFKKMTLDKGLDYEWDELLWSLVLSYNAAKQQSTGVAPFTLLFAQEATVPPDPRARPVLNFEEQEEKTPAEDLLHG
ncbi:hypothetical protein CYMTET_34122 [Cymbomonas tetramitiformis]|uniref:Integrase catalytic domain-containing protein n=1 Tax=Cymbomonas tetramitiformis TaxID=36881 RepID=A0AAE0KQI7_9CHLO|nr:hypothetical protein CYMTET_34122 [Cymbomonas tetramitiformis]